MTNKTEKKCKCSDRPLGWALTKHVFNCPLSEPTKSEGRCVNCLVQNGGHFNWCPENKPTKIEELPFERFPKDSFRNTPLPDGEGCLCSRAGHDFKKYGHWLECDIDREIESVEGWEKAFEKEFPYDTFVSAHQDWTYKAVKQFISKAIQDQKQSLIKKVEEAFDDFRSSNQEVNGQRRFGVANFKVGARDIHDKLLNLLKGE